jgi:sugar phosphate isomerase/epimerase
MSSANNLVLCSGTLATDTPLDVTVGAAHNAGFRGISLWGREYGRARRSGLSDADIRALLADSDMTVEFLDPAWWWLPGADDFMIPPEADDLELFSYGEKEMFAIADTVGASSILAIDAFGGSWSIDEAAEAFARFCDRAYFEGLHVHLEFLPWSRIPDLATAWQIVQRANRSNAGIAIDAWHWYRSDPNVALLASLPAHAVTALILDDAPASTEHNLLEAAMHARLLPGAGELNLIGLLSMYPLASKFFQMAFTCTRP